MVPDGLLEVYGLIHIIPNIPEQMFPSQGIYLVMKIRSIMAREDETELHYYSQAIHQETYEMLRLHIGAKKDPSLVKKYERKLREMGLYSHRLLYIPYTMYVVHGMNDEANRLYENMHDLSDTRNAIKIARLIQDLLIHEWVGVPETRLDQIFHEFLNIDEIFHLPLYKMVDTLYHKWSVYRYPRVGINLALLAYALGHNEIYRDIQNKLDITDVFTLNAKIDELKQLEKAIFEDQPDNDA